MPIKPSGQYVGLVAGGIRELSGYLHVHIFLNRMASRPMTAWGSLHCRSNDALPAALPSNGRSQSPVSFMIVADAESPRDPVSMRSERLTPAVHALGDGAFRETHWRPAGLCVRVSGWLKTRC